MIFILYHFVYIYAIMKKIMFFAQKQMLNVYKFVALSGLK